MRIGVAQMFIAEDLKTNYQNIKRLMEKAANQGIALLAFPEMSLSGFNPQTISQQGFFDDLAKALEEIGRSSRSLGLGVIVGHPLMKENLLYNAANVILPDGLSHVYCKINLTEEEVRYFAPGSQPLVFELNGYHFGVIICRDQNFPELARKVREAGARALFILSGHYYMPKEARWKLDKNKALPIARAVENHFYVLLANAVGAHISRISLGNSLIVDPDGTLIAIADEASETILSYDLEAL